jgi:predicted regulator of amino acid metabolism with ACT domain
MIVIAAVIMFTGAGIIVVLAELARHSYVCVTVMEQMAKMSSALRQVTYELMMGQ